MKVIIAGGRDFNNYQLLEGTMKSLNLDIDTIVCGCAKGADSLGRDWARNHQIPVVEFPAEWEFYGRAAGPIRNRKMGDYADYLVAFWDGQSHGTKDMIEYMKSLGKHGKVVLYSNGTK